MKTLPGPVFRSTAIFAGLLLIVVASGCASKKHVRAQVEAGTSPLSKRIGELESKSKDTDTALEQLERGVSQADERARGADGRAGDAMSKAEQSIAQADKSMQQADAASKAAAGAQSIAERGLAKADETEKRVLSLDNYKLLKSANVLFAFGKSTLADEGKQQLDSLVAELMRQTRYVVEVQGFTDNVGSDDYNLDLSRRRANEVVRYLTLHHKVPMHRIYELGVGEALPVGDAKSKEDRRQSRRVEVRLYIAGQQGTTATGVSGGGL